MIPEEYQDDIVQTSLEFVKLITLSYGADEGMKLWDTIVSTLDPDIKGKVFFAMLLGETAQTIIVDGYNGSVVNSGYGSWKVQMIKAVRAVSLLGLRESKDLIDQLTDGTINQFKLNIAPSGNKRVTAIGILKNAGLQAH